jgi:hypothetical protein
MEPLDAVPERRPIGLMQNIRANFEGVIRLHANEVSVKCCVVKLAERETIWDDRLTAFLGIGCDVCGIKKFLMPQPAERALTLIGYQDPLSECRLVQSTPSYCRDVFSPSVHSALRHVPDS